MTSPTEAPRTAAPRPWSLDLLEGGGYAVVVEADGDGAKVIADLDDTWGDRAANAALIVAAVNAYRPAASAPLDGERLYRAWWSEAWREGSNPSRWEQLSPAKQSSWNRVADLASTPKVREGGEQMRCQMITNARTYGGEDTFAQCWFYSGHIGPHWFGGEDYAETVLRAATPPTDEERP